MVADPSCYKRCSPVGMEMGSIARREDSSTELDLGGQPSFVRGEVGPPLPQVRLENDTSASKIVVAESVLDRRFGAWVEGGV